MYMQTDEVFNQKNFEEPYQEIIGGSNCNEL